jgi:uncharacterized protein YbbK (DUF523 family)
MREEMVELHARQGGVEACPEELGGLTTPRLASTLAGGSGDDVLDGRARVVASDGTDVTALFVEGAERTLALARESGAARAYLKKWSPSCGCTETSIEGSHAPGRGVAAALLARAGIEIIEVP